MTEQDRLSAFIEFMDRGNGSFLDMIEQEAIAADVPVIRKSAGGCLRFLISLSKPKRILEIGTAVGFSALLMSRTADREAHIDTIEKYEKRIPVAKENFRRAAEAGECNMDVPGRITLIEGDAGEVLKELGGGYDMIFMDAAKGQYINWLPDVLRLLNPGGILVSDNVLREGDIIESRFAVTRRNRTIHSRMREYIYELCHNPELETVILRDGDGMALSTRRSLAES
ncbi:MAG: O-methyltransferase [Lachnospiraceae bacterium]|nr:O-methyltransferase [Lachnospiraceae bacterium]